MEPDQAANELTQEQVLNFLVNTLILTDINT